MNLKLLILPFLLIFTLYGYSQLDDTKPTQNNFAEKIEQAITDSKFLNFYDAQKKLEEALILAKGLEDDVLVAKTSLAMSSLFKTNEQYSEAEVNCLRAITIYTALGAKLQLGVAYREYASIFLLQRKIDRATDYLDLAQRIFQEEDLPEREAYILKDKAVIANLEDMPRQVIGLLDLALPYIEDTSDPITTVESLLLRSEAHFKQFNIDSALTDAQKGMTLAKRYNLKNQEADIALQLSHIYEKKGDNKNAKSYLLTSNYLNKELRLEAEKKGLTKASNKRLEEKDEVITNLSEVNLQQKRDIRLNTIITMMAIAFITILSLLTLSLYKNNNIREKANTLLLEQRDELKSAKENAEKATKAKAQFLSTITHELRTPLYAVTGLTKLLLDENPSNSQMQHLNSLKFSGEYLLSLINDILDLNKLEANKVELRKDTFNIQKRIEDVLIALEHSAKKNNITIHKEFDESIPSQLIGDSVKISQVLINLIGNAIKFTKDGNIWIRTKAIHTSNEECNVHFEVEDDGVGISQEQQEKLFKIFSQGSLEINRKFGGTGLGLSIVKGILDLMNSQVTIQSELGVGSTFSFDINFKRAISTEDNQEILPIRDLKKLVKIPNTTIQSKKDNKTESTEKPIRERPLQSKLKGRHILIVEDNKINQMITRKVLEKNGATCEVTVNGETAVALTEDLEFDLILMDIHMPGIGGVVATERIRAFNTRIPILALTAVTLEDGGKSFFESGFNDIIPKPYTDDVFFDKILNALHIADHPLKSS